MAVFKVAIYVRLSKEDADKENDESESIANQKAMLITYANEKGWHIHKIYTDEDYSGSDATRPEFNEMLKDAERGEFQVVLCKSLSRFARDVALVETYINDKFLEWGIRFVSPTDYADTGVKGNRKNIQINSLVNQWYLEDLSENIKQVLNHKKREGKWVGGMTPYGYKKNPENRHQLIIDEEVVDIVKEIFSMYLSGRGAWHITNQLNQRKIPPPSAHKEQQGQRRAARNTTGKWGRNTIWNILGNPNYCGDMVQARVGKKTYKSKTLTPKAQSEWIIVEDTHEPIISKEDFRKVQEMKKEKSGSYNYVEKRREKENVFRGLVKCSVCGKPATLCKMTSSSFGDRSFRCNGRIENTTKCNVRTLPYSIIYNEVHAKITAYINDELQNMSITKHGEKDKGLEQKLKKEQAKLANRINDLNLALSNAFIEKSTNKISEEDYNVIMSGINTQKEGINEQIEGIQDRISELENAENAGTDWGEYLKSIQGFEELTHDVVRRFIEKIEIGEKTTNKRGVFNPMYYWKI